MECTCDDIELLLACQFDEVHGISGYPDGQLRIFFRVIHGIDQRLPVEHIDVQVVAVLHGVAIKDADQIQLLYPLFLAEGFRYDAECV